MNRKKCVMICIATALLALIDTGCKGNVIAFDKGEVKEEIRVSDLEQEKESLELVRTREKKGGQPDQIQAADAAGGEVKASVRAQDDFYEYENKEFLEQIRIPSDESGWTFFYDLENQVYQQMNAILSTVLKRKDRMNPESGTYKIAALYLTAMDLEARNQAGLGDLNRYLAKLSAVQTIEEYVDVMTWIHRETGFSSLLPWYADADLKNSARYAAYIGEPDLVLGKERLEQEEYAAVREKYKYYMARLLEGTGESANESLKDAQAILAFQCRMAALSHPMSERGDPDKINHPYTRDELARLFSNIDFKKYMKDSGMDRFQSYIVVNPEQMEYVNRLLTDKNLPLLKAYSRLILMNDMAEYLTIELRDQKLSFLKLLNGASEVYSDQKLAVKQAQKLAGFEFGRLYARQYFSGTDKSNIERMVGSILNTYKEMIRNLDWMGEETKASAIRKLDRLKIKVGYPEQWPDELAGANLKLPEAGGVLADNVLKVQKARHNYEMKCAEKRVDRSRWFMTPQTVNAYYNPAANEIVFPAAILQPPFYDRYAPYEQNLGGIGMVIAHEISHAFDDSGAKFDENGNLNDWWEPDDYENFKKLQEKVIQYYNGFEGPNGQRMNGELTLGENMADLGAMACITRLAGETDTERLKRLFSQYARIWACKFSPEEESNRLLTDPHSPGKIRVNAVMSSIEAFYRTFDVKPGDGMYVPAGERADLYGTAAKDR